MVSPPLSLRSPLHPREQPRRSGTVPRRRQLTRDLRSVAAQTLIEFGIPFRLMRATHSHEERDEAIEAINDAEDETKVLVTTYLVGGTGVNLHKACHHGIILQLPRNFSELYQAIMRLPRLGQTKAVHWDIIVDPDSFSAFQFRKLCVKYSRQLLAEARLPAAIAHHNLRLLLCYDIIQSFFGWPFNPFIWEIQKPTIIQGHVNPDTEFLGKVLTLVARALLEKSETHDHLVDEHQDINWVGDVIDLILTDLFQGATLEELEAESRHELLDRFQGLSDLPPLKQRELRKHGAGPAPPLFVYFSEVRGDYGFLSPDFYAPMKIGTNSFRSVTQ